MSTQNNPHRAMVRAVNVRQDFRVGDVLHERRSVRRNVIACAKAFPYVIVWCVIRSFACKETEKLFHGLIARAFPADIRRRARTKLLLLHASTNLEDLKNPPGNRLESLSGNRKGQHSIRINQQYRLCFRWSEQGADEVEITDYH
jgi:proteic killer suppression protein